MSCGRPCLLVSNAICNGQAHSGQTSSPRRAARACGATCSVRVRLMTRLAIIEKPFCKAFQRVESFHRIAGSLSRCSCTLESMGQCPLLLRVCPRPIIYKPVHHCCRGTEYWLAIRLGWRILLPLTISGCSFLGPRWRLTPSTPLGANCCDPTRRRCRGSACTVPSVRSVASARHAKQPACPSRSLVSVAGSMSGEPAMAGLWLRAWVSTTTVRASRLSCKRRRAGCWWRGSA